MLHPNQAEEIILNCVRPFNSQASTDVEWIRLHDAYGRILSADIVSQLDFPHWDNSAMDGYAVRFDDVKQASPEHPTGLQVVEEIPAGYQPQHSIQSGQAARIFTGAVMPPGADTIVIQEETRREGDRVIIATAPKFQAFVRHRAAFYQAGTPLLTAGTLISAAELAILAAAQCVQVQVYRRPVVAILSTGSELVSPEQPLQPGQIVDSNQYALAALIKAAGAIPTRHGIVGDTPEALKQAIATAVVRADMIVSSGGVSVGDYDYVDQVLADLGADLKVRSVAVKPGKPLTVATLACPTPESAPDRPHAEPQDSVAPSVVYFGLPGNPASAMVSFWRFVQPALWKRSGRPGPWQHEWLQGRSQQELTSGGQRETYLWGTVQLVNGEYQFTRAGGSHSSGNLINLANTNALAVIPVGTTHIAAGDPITLLRTS